MNAYFYDENNEYLICRFSLNKSDIEIIEEYGVEWNGVSYSITSIKYNINDGDITIRCKKNEEVL